MKIIFDRMWGLLGIAFLLISGSCTARELSPSIPTEEISAITRTPTVEPTHVPKLETIIFRETDESNFLAVFQHPNLWTRIDKTDYTTFPYDVISDYVYDKYGSLWIVGGFGILQIASDGKQSLYSIKNGLSRQFFTRIAISPSGEIWTGGTDNALFRFDGTQWINEGEKLPLPYDNRIGWLCYSRDISGIDFDSNGSAWVMNSGIEIYTQVYGQWVNIPFPKELLPVAGGGGCPRGLRVLSSDNITIMRAGCCMGSPVGYHFDGKEWKSDTDYSVVEELLFNRRGVTPDEFYSRIGTGSIYYNTGFANYLSSYRENLLPPSFYPSQYHQYSITSDKDGVIWLNDGIDLYKYSSRGFDIIRADWSKKPDLAQSTLIDFGTKKFFYQDEGKPYWLEWLFKDSAIGWIDASHAAIGKNNQLWVFSPQKGLILIENGNIKTIDNVPDILTVSRVGGIYIFRDGRIWIGGTGKIWEYQTENWIQYVIPNSEELFKSFIEDKNGVVYVATDTSVYRIENKTYSSKRFTKKHEKTYVESEDQGCDFHKNYSVCLMNTFGYSSSDTYKFVYLGIQDNGTLFYVNNRIVAKFEDGTWKSFFFDTFEIDSATIDKDGYLWLFSHSDGLFRFSPDIFDVYREASQ